MSSLRIGSAFALIFAATLGLPASASATTLTNGFNWDINDSLGFGNGTIGDGTTDAYDGCYYFTVGGTQYNLTGPDPATLSLSGRQVDLPPVDVGMELMAERHIYVPSGSANWARFVDIVENTSSTTITTTISITGNLGSDGSTILVSTSTGDTSLDTGDTWFATDDMDGAWDPSLAHVARGEVETIALSSISLMFDNVAYEWEVTIPPGGRVAIMTFAVQANDQATAIATATMLETQPDEILVGLDDWASDIINWGLASSGVCTGADGLGCSAPSGSSGICHAGRCCTGCWDGARCVAGRAPTACGIAGSACVRCAAIAYCTSAMCTAGVCNGSPCDDAQVCTTDTCDEATDSCSHAVTSGCIIGGECVGDGEHHVAYPCLVCDTARSGSDWSTEPTGTTCQDARCENGHLFSAGMCDATGVCNAPHPMACPSLSCLPDGTCEPPCTATSCPTGERCGALMHCEPVVALGGNCEEDSECVTGHCADGLCCDGACGGTCEACDLPGREGTCKPIASGTDPASECGDTASCDGHGGCASRTRDAGMMMMSDAGDVGPIVMDASSPDGGTVVPPPAATCSASGRSGGPMWLLALVGLVLVSRRRAW